MSWMTVFSRIITRVENHQAYVAVSVSDNSIDGISYSPLAMLAMIQTAAITEHVIY